MLDANNKCMVICIACYGSSNSVVAMYIKGTMTEIMSEKTLSEEVCLGSSVVTPNTT